MKKIYDMIVVGGGPGGYTAGLYGARAGLSVLVIEKLSAGGQMALTPNIENYPGFLEGVDGFELAISMENQAKRFGVETENTTVLSLSLSDKIKKAVTPKGEFFGKTIVISTGASPKELGLPNERELLGKGVAYCASCDGMFYKNKTVVVVGGGNTAAADALLLSRIAKQVIVVHRRDTLRATKIYHDSLFNGENISFCWDSTVTELLFKDKLTGIKIKNLKTNEESVIPCDGVFVSIGRNPETKFLENQINLSDSGYIISDESTKTNIEGVYAVGDVREKPLRQVVTAVSDGAVAAFMAEEYIGKGE